MCGISGIFRFDNQHVHPGSIRSMMQAMKHRGPDDEGIYIDGNVGLGHVRLSIIDLSPMGHQPMTDESGKLFIVYNGEVYNYLELKASLKSKYRFKSQTDTEVILHAYREWGERCLDHFNGMFAFAIYDADKKNLFIARDRFGIKPLYYYLDKQRFIFASDIAPILKAIPEKTEPNDQIIFDYLAYSRTNHTSDTFFRGIKKLQHSHKMTISRAGVKIERWYDLRENLKHPFQSPQELKEALIQSVRLQLRSDVPIGISLSGGLDSSSITSLVIHHFHKTDFYTYSAVYGQGEAGDESEFIQLYSPFLKGMKFTSPSAQSLLTDLDCFVKALAEPVPNSSEYAEFKVMQLAKGYSTVILNGQGADEEMGGYLYFMGYYYRHLLSSLNIGRFLKELYLDVKNHQSWEGPLSLVFFAAPAPVKKRIILHKRCYLDASLVDRVEDSPEILGNLYSAKTFRDALVNHFEHKFEHHLLWADKSGMWFSLETRFPFLDHHFVERIIPLDPGLQIQNGWMKHYLREAMKGVIPENIRLRKIKFGYETPEGQWFREENFQQLVHQALNSPSLTQRGYINGRSAQNLYRKHLNGASGISAEIWKWINLERWLYHFFDAPQNSYA